MNNIDCFWKTTVEIIFDEDKKPLKAKNIFRELVNAKTRKNILITQQDMVIGNDIDSFYNSYGDFKDFNFDGYLDFSIYNSICSGASHAFFDNYIFNPKTKKFDYDKKLSGSEITINKNQKTITLFYNMGKSYHLEHIIHYSKSGKIYYEEKFIEELMKEKKSDIYYYLMKYQKIKKNKVILKKSYKDYNISR